MRVRRATHSLSGILSPAPRFQRQSSGWALMLAASSSSCLAPSGGKDLQASENPSGHFSISSPSAIPPTSFEQGSKQQVLALSHGDPALQQDGGDLIDEAGARTDQSFFAAPPAKKSTTKWPRKDFHSGCGLKPSLLQTALEHGAGNPANTDENRLPKS